MPNRLIREEFLAAEKVNALTSEEECFYLRLIVVCDDYGLMDARPLFLKSTVFPIKTTVTEQDITAWLKRLEELELIERYEVKGAPFLYFKNWERYQNVKRKRVKYPPRPGGGLSAETGGGVSVETGGGVSTETGGGVSAETGDAPEISYDEMIENYVPVYQKKGVS